jgi:hypothetical protein
MFKQFKLACTLGSLAVVALLAQPASAVPVAYTFTGVASGTGTGATPNFTDESFTLTLTGDTDDIDTSAAPFYYLHNLGGTFSVGAFSADLDPSVTLVGSADPSLELINFFSADVANGLGLHNAALNGYDLSFSIGPLSDDGLTPTLNGGSFALVGGGTLQFTGNTSLTFTAAVRRADVPEPITLSLFAAGIAGIGAMRRRKSAN